MNRDAISELFDYTGWAWERIARVIDAGRRYAVVPWQMAIVARAMKLLPNAVYDRLFKRAGRKPRGLKL